MINRLLFLQFIDRIGFVIENIFYNYIYSQFAIAPTSCYLPMVDLTGNALGKITLLL